MNDKCCYCNCLADDDVSAAAYLMTMDEMPDANDDLDEHSYDYCQYELEVDDSWRQSVATSYTRTGITSRG